LYTIVNVVCLLLYFKTLDILYLDIEDDSRGSDKIKMKVMSIINNCQSVGKKEAKGKENNELISEMITGKVICYGAEGMWMRLIELFVQFDYETHTWRMKKDLHLHETNIPSLAIEFL
ncbi:hypothetical protein ACJX0J_012888, partial [Zea mays]